MKKLLSILAIASVLILSSCADNKTVNGITYRPYGLLNEETCKNDSIQYEVSFGAVVSGVLFSEIFLIPTLYTFGYNLWEPIGLKKNYQDGKIKGVIGVAK